MSLVESRIAALLSVLSENDDALHCPLSVFSRSLRELAWSQQRSANGSATGGEAAVDLSDVLAERSLALLREEEAILCDREIVRVAYDKLRAELARVEAQMQSLERRALEVAQQKVFCKLAMNITMMGAVPDFYSSNTEQFVERPRSAYAEQFESHNNSVATTCDHENIAKSASVNPAPLRQSFSSFTPQKLQLMQEDEGQFYIKSGEIVNKDKEHDSTLLLHKNDKTNFIDCVENKRSSAMENITSVVRNSSGQGQTSGGLLNMLRLPDVKESTLLHAIESYDKQYFSKSAPWLITQEQQRQQEEVLPVLIGLLKHLPQPRPPVQLAELRILGHVFRAAFGTQDMTNSALSFSSPPSTLSSPLPEKVARAMLNAFLHEGKAILTLTRLLQSVNEDVKCEVLECLLPILVNNNNNSNGTSTVSTTGRGNEKRIKIQSIRKEFIAAGGLQLLINIVASCTSEAVLERSLVLLWGLLASNDDEEKIHHEVRRLGGLRAVLDLLYTDSLPILENVAMTIGYITREEASKVDVREAGGLENITATLRHPHESIQTKMAGAVWNCASNTENRAYLRHIGCIPALLELLSSPYDFVQENAAGALWNLSVDPENKAQILEYGGIAELANLIANSKSVNVVENVSGTLWNCSAAVETRPAIRKAAAIPVLLSAMDRKLPSVRKQQQGDNAVPENSEQLLPMSDKILDNVAGTLRNCAINDQNKPAIREAGGVELLLKKLEQGILKQPASILLQTLDKMASTLWILTISPEIKHSVRLSGGIPLLAKMLEAASVTAAKKKGARSVVQLPMSVKEKIVGIIRNCSTVQENRPVMVAAGVVRVLVHVVEDCYLPVNAIMNSKQSAVSQQQQQQQQQPSLQLKETVASALWYLSRDDKVVPREEGGLELLCRILREPDQPSVVLEQAAGALSSLTVNSQENRIKLREFGGLDALLRLIQDKATLAFSQHTQGDNGNKTAEATLNSSPGSSSISVCNGAVKAESAVSHTYAVLNALLAVRNSTSSNEENLCCVVEWRNDDSSEDASRPVSPFVTLLLYIIQHGSEDCAREAALCVKNLCGHTRALELLREQGAVKALGGLAERGSTDSVRRAAAMTLHALSRTQRR